MSIFIKDVKYTHENSENIILLLFIYLSKS